MNFDSSSSYYPPSDDIYMPHLEKDYFSNFACCGLQLGDFHELVAHFEEQHVTVHGPAPAYSAHGLSAEPISPETSSSYATLESPRSTLSPTPPSSNPFPTLTAAFTPPESAFPPVHIKSDPPAYTLPPPDSRYNYSRSAESSSCGAPAVPVTHTASLTPLSVQPQASVRPPHQYASVAPANVMMQYPDPPSNAVTPPTIAPTPVYARHPNLSIITDLPRDLSESSDALTSQNTESEADEKVGLGPSGRRRRKPQSAKAPAREKMYKCPRVGCVKSYLNANGLKYHLNKGHCEMGSS